MLNHIALQINKEKDIKDFYGNIFGFQVKKSFELDSKLAVSIFGMKKQAKVVLMEKEDLIIELFITDVLLPFQGYQHTCLNVTNRDEILDSCREKNYEVIEIEREYHNLCFIKDKSENLFELKEL